MNEFIILYLLPIAIGVFSSLVASMVFLIFISRITPNIKISELIANVPFPESGQTVGYDIKIINRSRRHMVNIKAELHLISIKQIPYGSRPETKEIKLKRNNVFDIPGFNKKFKSAPNAFVFTTYENLNEVWKNDAQEFLRFKIYATDALTGFGKVFKQEYHTKRRTIKLGDFHSGNTLEIG